MQRSWNDICNHEEHTVMSMILLIWTHKICATPLKYVAVKLLTTGSSHFISTKWKIRKNIKWKYLGPSKFWGKPKTKLIVHQQWPALIIQNLGIHIFLIWDKYSCWCQRKKLLRKFIQGRRSIEDQDRCICQFNHDSPDILPPLECNPENMVVEAERWYDPDKKKAHHLQWK